MLFILKASKNGYIDIVNELIKANANVDLKDNDGNSNNTSDGNTALMLGNL